MLVINLDFVLSKNVSIYLVRGTVALPQAVTPGPEGSSCMPQPSMKLANSAQSSPVPGSLLALLMHLRVIWKVMSWTERVRIYPYKFLQASFLNFKNLEEPNWQAVPAEQAAFSACRMAVTWGQHLTGRYQWDPLPWVLWEMLSAVWTVQNHHVDPEEGNMD